MLHSLTGKSGSARVAVLLIGVVRRNDALAHRQRQTIFQENHLIKRNIFVSWYNYISNTFQPKK